MTQSKRRTLAIEVHPDAQEGARLVLRAPSGMAWEELAPRVLRRASWIARQAIHFDRFRPGPQPRQYANGATVRLLGHQLVMKVSIGKTSVRKDGQRLLVAVADPDSERLIAQTVQRWMHQYAKAEFALRLEQWRKHPLLREVPALRLHVRWLERRWGSLSAQGTLTLHTGLVEAPPECIDYVIAHELCHHWHPDHGDSFWQMLAEVLPDWDVRKARLADWVSK